MKLVQRTCSCGGKAAPDGECAECRKKRLVQRQARARPSAGLRPSKEVSVESVVSSPGRPLDERAREFMESRMGRDFSDVRIHTDDRAAKSARSENALAYTLGQHVVFGAGQYQPDTLAGKRLLAHELTHTIQQRNGRGLQRQEEPEADGKADRLLDAQIEALEAALLTASEGGGAERSGAENGLAGGDPQTHLRVALERTRAVRAEGSAEEKAMVAQTFLRAVEERQGDESVLETSPIARATATDPPSSDPLEREATTVASRVVEGSRSVDLGSVSASGTAPHLQREAATATLIAGGVSAGPVGWAILGAVAVVAVGAGIYYLSTRPTSTSSSPPRSRSRPRTRRPSGSCETLLSACLLTSLADHRGSVHGQSRCVMCFEGCLRNGGVWPGSMPTTTSTVRCDFWNFPSTSR